MKVAEKRKAVRGSMSLRAQGGLWVPAIKAGSRSCHHGVCYQGMCHQAIKACAIEAGSRSCYHGVYRQGVPNSSGVHGVLPVQGIGRSGLGSPRALQEGLMSRSVVRGSGFALCLAGRSGGSRVARSRGGSKDWRWWEALDMVVSKVWR